MSGKTISDVNSCFLALVFRFLFAELRPQWKEEMESIIFFFFKQITESIYVSRATAIHSMPSEVLTWNIRKQTVLEAG